MKSRISKPMTFEYETELVIFDEAVPITYVLEKVEFEPGCEPAWDEPGAAHAVTLNKIYVKNDPLKKEVFPLIISSSWHADDLKLFDHLERFALLKFEEILND